MRDYHDLSLKCDVSLLANVFEKFTNGSLKNYGLYSSNYLRGTSFNLGCNAQYHKRWPWTYFESWHEFGL